MTRARHVAPKKGNAVQLSNPVSWAVLGIIGILALGVGAIGVYLPGAMQSAALDAAHRANLEVAGLIKITRGYYTQDVVAKVVRSGVLNPSIRHKDDATAIPLPATFVKDISDLLKEKATSLSLVSPYPWPHRAERMMDDFETTAWAAFQNDPNMVFSRLETRDGQRVLRVAVADRMTTETCVSCHNNHPQSVRRDWKVGDVRAVMQVTKVVEPYIAAAEQRSQKIIWTVAAAAFAAAITLLAITLLVARRTREKREADLHVRYLAHHDALTDLPNRVLLRERLTQALSAAGQDDTLAVFFIDLDRFKEVNDAFGHSTGDIALRAAAARLRSCVREGDTIARIGGDEFVILQVAGKRQNDPASLAARVIEAMRAPLDVDGHLIAVGASIGIAVSPDDGSDPDKLLRNADLAAYNAKSDGRGIYRFFRPEMDADARTRRELEQDLRQALAVGEFELYYQPVVDIETRRKVSMEALVRWGHPVRGFMTPDSFISIAEESGLIKDLGNWVLRQACSDAVKWSDTKVAVNLSPVQFQNPDLANEIRDILAETKLPPERLELEVTESVLLNRTDKNIAILHQLRGLGLSVALDDFGTGYSSLSYLRMFPFDKIKIDRSFVSEMSKQDECAAIVCAVASLGRSLDIVTTAEGVETEEQLDLVRAAGCTQAQGFLFGRPCPVVKLNFDRHIVQAAAQVIPALTTTDIMLVRASFSQVVPIQGVAANLFYDRLFTIAPELRTLFPDDLSQQKHKLIAMLATGIGKLHDLSALTPVIEDLGARHAAYGTRTEHYAIVAEALLWALEKGLGDAFTPEVRSAWTKVYELLAATMQAGAAEAAKIRAA